MGVRVDWYNAVGERWCCGCQAHLSPDQFGAWGPRAPTPDKLQAFCRLCRREIRHRTYMRHREREIASARAWQAAHPEETRAARRRAQRVQYRLKKLAREAARSEREEQAG